MSSIGQTLLYSKRKLPEALNDRGSSETLPMTSSQREELDRRLDELENEGPTGLSWDEVVAQRSVTAAPPRRPR